MSPDGGKAFLFLFIGVLVMFIVYKVTTDGPVKPANYNVNEHNFIKAVRARYQSEIATVLGNPDESGEGEVVQVPSAVSADGLFTISTNCEKSPPDYFAYFKGAQNEQIRLLYTGENKSILAAEYLVDNAPVYYLGPTSGCRSIEIKTIGRGIDDAAFLVRKKQLADFFHDSFGQAQTPRAGSVIHARPDRPERPPGRFGAAITITAPTPPAPALAPAPAPAPTTAAVTPSPASGTTSPSATASPAMSASAAPPPSENLEPPGKWIIAIPNLPTHKISSEITIMPADWVQSNFPGAISPWIEYYPDGTVHAVVSIDKGSLHGATAFLFRTGAIATLAHYDRGGLCGPLRLWNEYKEMVLYSEYAHGKKEGYTIFFQNMQPSLLQYWQGGRLIREYTVAITVGGKAILRAADPANDDAGLRAIRASLKELTGTVARNNDQLRKDVRALIVKNARAAGGISATSVSTDFRSVLGGSYTTPTIVQIH